ncbi:MAG: hypothetical protein ACFFDH_06195 [Promethearchaeota archaeon]
MEIILTIGEKYIEIFGMSQFLTDPNADPRVWVRKNLELNKKKTFINAMEREAISRPNELQAHINENIKNRKETQKRSYPNLYYDGKVAGKKISIERAQLMQKVYIVIMRRYIVFGNHFCSDD